MLVPCGTSSVSVPCGTGTCYRYAVFTKPVLREQGQKRPVHCFMTGDKWKLETCPCFRDMLCTHDGTCSRLEQVVQPLKLYYLRRHLHRVIKCRRHLCPKPPETFERKLSLFWLKEPLIKIQKSFCLGNFHGTWISFCSFENVRSWPESLAKPGLNEKLQSRLL